MDKSDKSWFPSIRCRAITITLCTIIFVAIAGCAKPPTREVMQPLAATASDLARAVMQYAVDNPAEGASLDDRQLVRRATAYAPKLLEPYENFVVRGTTAGIILVCSGDGQISYIEDAECTDIVDKILWNGERVPCRFSLDLKEICP